MPPTSFFASVRASVFDDGQLMLMSAALLRRGDVVMAFSHSGQTAAVVEAARQARQNGAQLIALTNRSDSPLGRESDVALCANLDSLPWAGEMRRRAWCSSAFSTRS